MECVVRERFMGNQSQPAGEGAVYAPNSQGDAEERVWGFLWVRQADKVANFKGKREKMKRRGVRALQVQKAPNNPHTG